LKEAGGDEELGDGEGVVGVELHSVWSVMGDEDEVLVLC